jgi:hypothetical protein
MTREQRNLIEDALEAVAALEGYFGNLGLVIDSARNEDYRQNWKHQDAALGIAMGTLRTLRCKVQDLETSLRNTRAAAAAAEEQAAAVIREPPRQPPRSKRRR